MPDIEEPTDGRNTVNKGLLIIDDEGEILKALRREFRRDYTVFIADSAEQGYEIMKEHTISVVISDQRMPGMTGSQFFKTIKVEFPDAVRLLLTGYADIEAVIEAINEGNVFRYITKPWNPNELRSIVHEAFGRYHLVMENHRLVDDLRLALEKEALYARLKSRLMMTIAHQFRTPLAVINSTNELLQNYWKRLSDEQRENKFNKVNQQIEYLVSVLDRVSRMAEIEASDFPFRPVLSDVNGLTYQYMHDFQQRFPNSHRYEFTGTDQLQKTLVDPDLLRHIMDNLLANASNFSPQGSTIQIDVQTQADSIKITVSDEGMGIPTDDLPFVFDAYFRGENVVQTEHIKGIGLGLKIVKDCVELHNGWVEANSVENKGSTFSVSLPVVKVAVP